jgi:hypothetical protein
MHQANGDTQCAAPHPNLKLNDNNVIGRRDVLPKLVLIAVLDLSGSPVGLPESSYHKLWWFRTAEGNTAASGVPIRDPLKKLVRLIGDRAPMPVGRATGPLHDYDADRNRLDPALGVLLRYRNATGLVNGDRPALPSLPPLPPAPQSTARTDLPDALSRIT